MYKIGDMVRVIGREREHPLTFLNRIGKVIKVGNTDRFMPNGSYCVSVDYVVLDIERNSFGGGFWADEVELVKKEIKTFKIAEWCKKTYANKI